MNAYSAPRILTAIFLTSLFCAWTADAVCAAVSVTTYHYDNLRTGWNSQEKTLTQSNVGGSGFGMLHTVTLDEQVDAQPLVVPNVTINGQQYTVLYVVTENNSVYALDATNGNVLVQTNLGNPVHYTNLPSQCTNNGPNVGISSTPVIDPSSGTLYLIAYTWENNAPVYRIHALSISTLKDTVTPVVITASGTLTNGSIYTFNPVVSRQRAGLLLSNNTIYAGFSSFCDAAADKSRGWVLGWQAGTLAPLANNELTNKRAKSTNKYFLTSVWMSGYALAANSSGSVYFTTGNSDPSDSYNSVTNISESVVQMSSDLSMVQSLYTPTGHSQLDSWDGDFSAGGVILLPPQGGSFPDVAAAAGKDGYLYVLNSDNLSQWWGAYIRPEKSAADKRGCWCGPSYFQGSDGIGRLVVSVGTNVATYSVSSTDQPRLTVQYSTTNILDGQDPGFFTSVSSNGTNSGTAVIWAVGKPVDTNHTNVDLYAFNANTGKLLFDGVAGQWPHLGGNANIVPVVANGLVYVASNQMLTIFGTGAKKGMSLPEVRIAAMQVPLAEGQHEIFGTVRSITGAVITVAKRDGEMLRVDATDAMKGFRFAQPRVGHALVARGRYTQAGVLKAKTLLHAKDNPGLWPEDR